MYIIDKGKGKGAFRDALALRYGRRPGAMASICACGSNNDVDHAMSCGRGGYVMMRHNEIRDLTASFLCEVATCVKVEPNLQPITEEGFGGRSANVKENSRLDVKCKETGQHDCQKA